MPLARHGVAVASVSYRLADVARWPAQLHDAKGAASDQYGVQALPNMFVIGRDGRIAHVHRGYSAEMLEGFIGEILALLPEDVLKRPAGSQRSP